MYLPQNLTDRTTANSAYLKDTEAELSRLQKQLDIAVKARDNAVEVNRKLQDELAAVSREAITFKTHLTKSQEQIENLKLQSQQYIAEVKRAEDLIEGKEKEREDLLNQFKQLCLETNNLQNSNSALETEANQSKVQLSVAMDHVHDLEHRSETLETLINDYEKQIGLLTNQIAKFESDRNQHLKYQDRTEVELRSVRELCMKLDKEKEQLRIQLSSKETNGDRLEDFRRETENLSARLTESQTKLANTERLLKEARHQSVEMKLKDEEALNEISLLRERINDLEKRLEKASQDVDMYQEKAFECNNQIRQLRRQLTDERFGKASRGDDDRFRCTCYDCDTEKCNGALVRGNGQIMNAGTKSPEDKRQTASTSSLFDSSKPAFFPSTSESGGNNALDAGNNTLVATAQVVITDEGGMETLTVRVSQANSPRESDRISLSSVRMNVSDPDGEVRIQARPVKGIMTARVETVGPPMPSVKTKDDVCNSRSSRSTSTSESSRKSLNCAAGMEKLEESLIQGWVDRPGKYCKKGKCYPECKLFDPLNRVCRKERQSCEVTRSKNCNIPPSTNKHEKDALGSGCLSTCCCGFRK